MRSSVLCLLCLVSFASVVNAQESDPAYAVLLQRLLSSLPTMIQTQLEGKPENVEKILMKVMGDGLLGKLLSDPIQMAKQLTGDDHKDKNTAGGGNGEENGLKKLWSSVTQPSTSISSNNGSESSASTLSPLSAASPAAPVVSVQPPTADQLTGVDEKKLAEALLEALKKSISSTPSPEDYASLMPHIDFTSDGKQYRVPNRQEEFFRRAPPSQRYRYGMKYVPTEEQVIDDVNQEAVLAYAKALRNQQTAFLSNQQLPRLMQQQQPAASQEQLTPEEAIRMHEILNAYDAKLGRQSQEIIRSASQMQLEEYVDLDQQKSQKEPELDLSLTQTTKTGRPRSTHRAPFPDMIPSAAETSSTVASTVDSDDSSDESETLASIPGRRLAQIDSECGCVPLDLEMMEGDWVQALGSTDNVRRIYKGALHLMQQESSKADVKPICARFKFENAITGHSRDTQEANMSWTFRTSEEGKTFKLQGTVIATDHRTLQLQLEGPNSYKFNLPVCAQKTGTSGDGTKYNYIVLAETVGKDKCLSAHVLVRNPAAFFHERNEDLIDFLKTRIDNDAMKPVSVVPFGKNCD